MSEDKQTSGAAASAEEIRPVFPGGVVGVLGGGQLGRMLGQAARRMGYGFRVYEPELDCPASAVADMAVAESYENAAALREFVGGVDVLTLEFENIPSSALEDAAGAMPVRPSPHVLHICQNREREKQFLSANGFPCARHVVVTSAAEAAAAAAVTGFPCVLKTADFGYDGKGQRKIHNAAEAAEAWTQLSADRAVIEEWVDFRSEISVVCARGLDGRVECFPASENIHRHHILDRSIVPARIDPGVAREAQRLATALARELDVRGLLAVEFFVRRDGSLLVNEMAPRPHNSGHFTLDACVTSQFEQQLRAVCGLPLGSSRLLSPVVMVNILGDAWETGEPDWNALLSDPDVRLHLYGKREPRAGRKMGHFTVVKPDLEEALRAAELAEARLFRRAGGTRSA
jgi:5-(carboxyamino)imidazole ribonucleotide synthase